MPDGLAAEAVPIAVRVVVVARDAVLWQRLAGTEAALACSPGAAAGPTTRRWSTPCAAIGVPAPTTAAGLGGRARRRAGAGPAGRRRGAGSGAGRGRGLRRPAIDGGRGAARTRVAETAAAAGRRLRPARRRRRPAASGGAGGRRRGGGRAGRDLGAHRAARSRGRPSGSGCIRTCPSGSWAAAPGCGRWPRSPGPTMSGWTGPATTAARPPRSCRAPARLLAVADVWTALGEDRPTARRSSPRAGPRRAVGRGHRGPARRRRRGGRARRRTGRRDHRRHPRRPGSPSGRSRCCG